MEVRNCPSCGKMFVYVGRRLCPQCREADEKDFELVRGYLQKHPGSNIEGINEATGVKKEKILEFMREGRLERSPDGLAPIKRCQICGKTISQGRICNNCLRQFKTPLGGERPVAGPEARGRVRSRMYIKDIWDKKERK